MTEQVTIYTDGACSGNPGPGGWGWIRVVEGIAPAIMDPLNPSKTLKLYSETARGSGGEENTTNNRMELMAVISGLYNLNHKPDLDITVVTDSKYVLQGITEWIKGWKAKGWIGSNKKPVKNRDLWERLDSTVNQFSNLKWKWVKGHSGNTWNEAVDQLAVSAIPEKE
jgi:ribonuclease HI